MIPSNLFMRLIDLQEKYLKCPTLENFRAVCAFQDEIGWPFKANLEQLNCWDEMNHEPEFKNLVV